MASKKNVNKILLESEMFLPASGKSSELPCRSLWDLVIYDSKNHITKLEDLSSRGPFTAVATANDSNETKPENLGSTVIISPIMEYSMEYPYGKEAVVWLRSNQAFYRIMTVSHLYASVWKPLKGLLDISGHVVNIMLRSNTELLTPYFVKKVADLAGKTLRETVELITTGRSFIIEQIRNQEKARLLKFQFFKDLSNAKTWLQFRISLDEDSTASSSTVTKAKPAIKAKEKEPEPKLKPKKSESPPPDQPSAAPPLPPVPTKVRIAAPSKVNSSAKAEQPVKKKKATVPKKLKEPVEVKVKEKALKKKKESSKKIVKMEPQKAKRSDMTKSIVPPSIETFDLPVDVDFEYKCHVCGVHLEKSRGFPELLPRIKLHMQMHSSGAIPDRDNDESFSERFETFIEYVGKRKEVPIEEELFTFPSRDFSGNERIMAGMKVPERLPRKEVPVIGNVEKVVLRVTQEPKGAKVDPRNAEKVVPRVAQESKRVAQEPKRVAQEPKRAKLDPVTIRPKAVSPKNTGKPKSPPKSNHHIHPPAAVHHKHNSPTKASKGSSHLPPNSTIVSKRSPQKTEALPRPTSLSIPERFFPSSSPDLKFQSLADAYKSAPPPNKVIQITDTPQKKPQTLGDLSDIYARKAPSPIKGKLVDLTTSAAAPVDPRLLIKKIMIDLDDEPNNRLAHRSTSIILDSCWKCGFRVNGRVCRQCGSVQ